MSQAAADFPSAPLLRTVCAAAALGTVGAMTVGVAIVADGHILSAVAPIIVVGLLWLIWVLPLRVPLLAVTFLALMLDKPGDASGMWQSPLAPVGGLLIENLNKTIDIPALKVSVLVLLMLYLLAIRSYRVWSGVEEQGAVAPSSALTGALLFSLVSVVLLAAFGVARGGDLQMVKLQLLVFLTLLAFAYLSAVSLRGPTDYRRLAALVVVAACIKAVMAVWVRASLPRFVGTLELEYATTHGDSLLFACAFVVMIAAYFERPTRCNFWRGALVLPVLMAGLMANDRRLAWVQIAGSLVILLALNRRRRLARVITRAAIVSLPVLVLYVAIGWNSQAPVFGPVQIVRSMQDQTVDRSTLFRDIENFNLLATLNLHPLIGTGFGHPFEEVVKNDALPGFREYLFLPHNSILGLLAFAGVFGFCAMWSAMLVGLFLAVRSYRFATVSEDRVAAVMAITSIVVYLVHCWGDIGFTEYKSIFIVGSGLALAAQTATRTGAWLPSTMGRRATAAGSAWA